MLAKVSRAKLVVRTDLLLKVRNPANWPVIAIEEGVVVGADLGI